MPGYWDRIRKYIRGGPEAIDGWPARIPAADFLAAIDKHLGSPLRGAGFETVSPRRWVRSTATPIRHVVELQALKGLTYCPQWGLSLGFVPHVTGKGEVRWHRTAKAARLDLVHRPIDFEPDADKSQAWAVSPAATPEELDEDLARVAALTLEHGGRFFSRVGRIEDLPDLYAEHRARPAVGLPFTAFPQQVLAHAFVAARCRRSDATMLLEEYLAWAELPTSTSQRLRSLLDEARDG